MKNIGSNGTKGKADFFMWKEMLTVRSTVKPYSPNLYFYNALKAIQGAQSRYAKLLVEKLT